ncbi:hypothetical protein E3E31_07520 [Thermococcus sp. M39]|uniref:hypothetical protein n=1 Tax=unclassified Thermococcus TaxID=2627626 RepID=UPI00143A30B1|nr:MULTISPECIES: hypothetical protein [unclassified Thermococcus]NJE08372.1 hypothetical protein [Thermococcus sp. M39]NJE11864.1 hypothetical protein [Thermococcus sp. LS2]
MAMDKKTSQWYFGLFTALRLNGVTHVTLTTWAKRPRYFFIAFLRLPLKPHLTEKHIKNYKRVTTILTGDEKICLSLAS